MEEMHHFNFDVSIENDVCEKRGAISAAVSIDLGMENIGAMKGGIEIETLMVSDDAEKNCNLLRDWKEILQRAVLAGVTSKETRKGKNMLCAGPRGLRNVIPNMISKSLTMVPDVRKVNCKGDICDE
jgi:hypothetical protein